MTASLVYQIHCDACAAVFPYVHRYTGDVRWHAAQEGWTYGVEGRGRDEKCRDRCEMCKP